MNALIALTLIGSLSAPAPVPVPAACVTSQVRVVKDMAGTLIVAKAEAACPLRRGGIATLSLDGQDVATVRFERLPVTLSARVAPGAAPVAACVRVDLGGPAPITACHALPLPAVEPFDPGLRVVPRR